MKLSDIVFAIPEASTCEYGSKIPWDDPDFSERMLNQHLSQDHDWASRRQNIIASHVDWISGILPVSPARILDLGCGPGFYTQALAERGHACVGVDFSPASIAYARRRATGKDLDLEYIQGDIREFTAKEAFDCILMTFGEFNAFTSQDAEAILSGCAAMLKGGGVFILEAHTLEAVRQSGQVPATWQRHESGLFSERPHLLLQENLWNETEATSLNRFYVVDVASAEARVYCSFMQGYDEARYSAMLQTAGFALEAGPGREFWPSGEDFEEKLKVYSCRKRG